MVRHIYGPGYVGSGSFIFRKVNQILIEKWGVNRNNKSNRIVTSLLKVYSSRLQARVFFLFNQ